MKTTQIKLKSGLSIPSLGVGTTDLTHQNNGSASIETAIKHGYRLVDTATAYQNHTTVAQALKESMVKREEIIICTKINDNDLVKSSVAEVVAKMLLELNTDYLDMVLIHSPAVLQHFPQAQVLNELIKLKESGKIKSIGISNFSKEHFQLLGNNLAHIDVNQIELNPYCQQLEMTAFCQEHGIHIMAYRPFGKGKSGDLLANENLKEIAAKYNKSVPQLILAWLIQKGFSTIPKAGSADHISENSEIFDFTLSPTEMAVIAGLNRNLITCDWTKYVKTKPVAASGFATFDGAFFTTAPVPTPVEPVSTTTSTLMGP